jgi:hypothetical protein
VGDVEVSGGHPGETSSLFVVLLSSLSIFLLVQVKMTGRFASIIHNNQLITAKSKKNNQKSVPAPSTFCLWPKHIMTLLQVGDSSVSSRGIHCRR